MGTETHLSLKNAPVRVVSASRWLQALHADNATLSSLHAIIGRLSAGWTTQPRTPETRYLVNYLFRAPTASLVCHTSDGLREFPVGALLWVPPGVYYELALRTSARSVMLQRLRFRLDHGGENLTLFRTPTVVHPCDFFDRIVHELSVEEAVPAPLARERIGAILSWLAVDTLRMLARPAAEPKRRLNRAQCMRLMQYVAEHQRGRPAPGDLASVLRLNAAYFARVFQNTFGVSPRRWLVEERVRYAAQLLLESSITVKELAHDMGYPDPHLFSRQFRQVMGASPRQYRGT